jgi:hypothetical protein
MADEKPQYAGPKYESVSLLSPPARIRGQKLGLIRTLISPVISKT